MPTLARECLCVTLKTHKPVGDPEFNWDLSWSETPARHPRLPARLEPPQNPFSSDASPQLLHLQHQPPHQQSSPAMCQLAAFNVLHPPSHAISHPSPRARETAPGLHFCRWPPDFSISTTIRYYVFVGCPASQAPRLQRPPGTATLQKIHHNEELESTQTFTKPGLWLMISSWKMQQPSNKMLWLNIASTSNVLWMRMLPPLKIFVFDTHKVV